jgi:hypothetical protein
VKKLKVYLDTSIINFLTVEDSPDYRRDTEVFFETVIEQNKIIPYISRVVTEEINDTKEIGKREKLLNTLEKHPNIGMLIAEGENVGKIAFLADIYIKNGIIPRKKVADAFHIAYSTVFEMDILLSWNFKHLANVNKERKIIALNETNGYNYPFRMANPLEVLSDE